MDADDLLRTSREAFMDEHFGTASLIIHPFFSEIPHVDICVYWWQTERGAPLLRLVTDGLSDHLMNTARATSPDACQRAELVMYVPPLPLSEGQIEQPWQVHLLQDTARFPVESDLWLEPFLCLPNGNPAQPFEGGSLLTHYVLMPPIFESPAVKDGLSAPDGTTVEYLWIELLTEAESNVLRAQGPGGLGNLLHAAKHVPPTDMRRRSYV
jgi:hypothetical protein